LHDQGNLNGIGWHSLLAAGLGAAPGTGGLSPAARTSTILRANDPQTEVRNALTNWVIDKVADRVVTAVIGAIV
jgi:hypothetical protein